MTDQLTPQPSRLGTYLKRSVAGETYQAFVPPPLPPAPPLELTGLQKVLARAGQALGRLDGVTGALPDTHLLLYYYVRKEAVLSSQIEGTQSSLSDLLLYESEEAPTVPLDDVTEVSSYVAAMAHGLDRLRGGFPLSLRLLREMHAILLAKGRGADKLPGEFRTSQNWIGGSRPGNASFVPPPPENLMDCLGAFERYIHAEEHTYPSLLVAGLLHVQFETIHPFLDGNGRVGRLLITLYLIMMGDLRQPSLYLSLFFKNNRQAYYDRLTAVRETGDWEGWLDFYLTGVAETATQVVDTSQKITDLLAAHQERIAALKRAGINARKAHDLLAGQAILSVKEAAKQLDVTVPTARAALKNLAALGIVHDISGRGKERLYVYTELLELLEAGAKPISY